MDVQQLVEKAQTGDLQAFEQVCRQFAKLVHKQALQAHLGTIREEAMAEGWLALAEAIIGYNPATGVPFAGYAESKVKFALWNLFKRERRRWQQEVTLEGTADDEEGGASWLESLPAPEHTEEQVVSKLMTSQMLSLLNDLPERQRQAILLTVVQQKKLHEAASRLQVTPQAVHHLRQRGLVRLKQLCAGMYESERG